MTELLDNIFAIPCPETLAALNLYGNADGVSEVRALDWKIVSGQPKTKQWNYFLPPGSYEIMFTTKGVSEQDAKKVVQKRYNGGAAIYPFYFRDYEKKDMEFSYGAATESLQSLLKSKGLTAGNYLIIKKQLQ